MLDYIILLQKLSVLPVNRSWARKSRCTPVCRPTSPCQTPLWPPVHPNMATRSLPGLHPPCNICLILIFYHFAICLCRFYLSYLEGIAWLHLHWWVYDYWTDFKYHEKNVFAYYCLKNIKPCLTAKLYNICYVPAIIDIIPMVHNVEPLWALSHHCHLLNVGGGAILDSLCRVGWSVGRSVRLQFLSAL